MLAEVAALDLLLPTYLDKHLARSSVSGASHSQYDCRLRSSHTTCISSDIGRAPTYTNLDCPILAVLLEDILFLCQDKRDRDLSAGTTQVVFRVWTTLNAPRLRRRSRVCNTYSFVCIPTNVAALLEALSSTPLFATCMVACSLACGRTRCYLGCGRTRCYLRGAA